MKKLTIYSDDSSLVTESGITISFNDKQVKEVVGLEGADMEEVQKLKWGIGRDYIVEKVKNRGLHKKAKSTI